MILYVLNFKSKSTNATARHQVSSIIVSDIRRAQSLAISGAQARGQIVCGYGIHYLNNGLGYTIYAKLPNPANKCTGNVTYNNTSSINNLDIETKTFANPSFTVDWSPFNSGTGNNDDVFFKPPDPTTFINNKDLSQSPNDTVIINIYLNGSGCPGTNCTSITVYKSGKIDITN